MSQSNNTATESPSPSARRVVQVVSAVAIVVSGGYLLLPPRAPAETTAVVQDTTPPPAAQRVETANGIMARLDLTALERWCTQHDLPAPPPLREMEPAVADALLAAYRDAATEPSAANLGKLGMVCASLFAHDSAERCFVRAAQADPQDFRWPYYLGCIYHRVGRSAAARAALERAESLTTQYPMIHGRLAYLYLEAGDPEKARHHAQRYIAERSNDSIGHVILARLALADDDADGALGHARVALQHGPGDFQVHYVLARCYQELGQHAEAARHFKRCEQLPSGRWFKLRDPLLQEADQSTSSTGVLIGVLSSAHAAGDFERAADIAERILERRPTDALMMTNLARCYRKLQRFDDAEAILQRAEATQPGLLWIATGRSELYLERGDYPAALAEADDIIADFPDVARAWAVRGRALAMLKRYEEAATALTQCVHLEPDDAGNILVLAEINWALGHLDAAADGYRRVLRMLPGQALARQRLQQIEASHSTEGQP